MKKYKHLYFDLDRTLWDFETNSYETLLDIFCKYNLQKSIENKDVFIEAYRYHNKKLWEDYGLGKIKKKELITKRFLVTLEDFDINLDSLPDMAKQMGIDYITISPTKTKIFPYTHEALSYLKERYKLYVLTNGFRQVQITKLKNCNLEQYFTKLICSEDAGTQKPKPEIFRYALKTVNAKKIESIMIGDDMNVDILGAKKVGVDQVFFNPQKTIHDENPTFEINSLIQLLDIFD
ncbi:MAG: noncanonical pyrimidine nucleotidase, YjjG family [Bacteroidetes bacterium]|nr:noncanonical pyrimidine nucleotidase, YjjG family [Bacteroidota bacterium]